MDRESLSHCLVTLEQALDRLGEALAVSVKSNPLALDATIQRFEFTYELLWKTIARFTQVQGLNPKTPRAVFQVAFQLGWIKSEDLWLSMLSDRNLTSHTYREKMAVEIYERIHTYYPEMQRLVRLLKEQIQP